MSIKHEKIKPEIRQLIVAYDDVVKGIVDKAKAEKERAYGGVIRGGKGKLVETIAENIVLIAWKALEGKPARLSFGKSKVKVPIKEEYFGRIKNPLLRKVMLEHKDRYYYAQKADKQVLVDGKFVMGIECKTYAENAMMKRVLIDFSLLKRAYPNLDCVLFQLESQLTGDYSELKDPEDTIGSYSTHTLFSFFELDLHIITLLKGERKVDKPIHEKLHYKPLTEASLFKAINIIGQLLRKHK